eukprot:2494096-Rhodomonas_salina.2
MHFTPISSRMLVGARPQPINWDVQWQFISCTTRCCASDENSTMARGEIGETPCKISASWITEKRTSRPVPVTCDARSEPNAAGNIIVALVCANDTIVVDSATSTTSAEPESVGRLLRAIIVTAAAEGSNSTSPHTNSSPTLASSCCITVSKSSNSVWVPENVFEVQEFKMWSA